MFLTLDLGAKTGYCLFAYDKGDTEIIESGTKNFKTRMSESLGKRFVLFRNWLGNVLKKYNVDAVFYEHVYAHSGTQAAHIYGGFLYHLAVLCDDWNVKLHGIGVCEIKKAATGYGRASKQQVMDAVRKYSSNLTDDNEADAIAIMLAVKAYI